MHVRRSHAGQKPKSIRALILNPETNPFHSWHLQASRLSEDTLLAGVMQATRLDGRVLGQQHVSRPERSRMLQTRRCLPWPARESAAPWSWCWTAGSRR